MRPFVRRFVSDESGVFVIFAVYIFIAMLIVAGIGVDIMRYERDRAELQYTLDRAVLAAADLDQTRPAQEVVQDYFDKAGLGEYLTSVTPEETLGYRKVTATADGHMWTQFMHMTGVDKMDTWGQSTAIESIPNVEISLVLDISGSMRWNNRMNNLRPAAKNFISTVLKTPDLVGERTTSINVVPYAGQVNPGTVMFDYLEGERFGTSGADYFPERGRIKDIWLHFDESGGDDGIYSVHIDNFPGSSESGWLSNDLDDFYAYAEAYVKRKDSTAASADVIGVTMRQKGGHDPNDDNGWDTTFYDLNGYSGDTPDPEDVEKYLTYNDFKSEILPNHLASCMEVKSADFDTTGLPSGGTEQTSHFMMWNIAADVMDWGWCPQNDTPIVYAQNSESSLHTYIDNIRMHDGTGTFYGMKWALALLDPGSKAAFSHLNAAGLVPDNYSDRPSNWREEGWAKYVVLMTDGQITDQWRPVDKLDPINGTTELKKRPSSDRYKFTSRSTNLNRFYTQCNLAKQNGVVVFTIAFEAPSGAQTEMRNCASSPSHFFKADSGGSLDDAFQAIARQINQLRLTQ